MTIYAAPGDWVEIEIPVDTFPVSMKFGDTEPVSAFIDHVKQGAGVATIVKQRCPDLPRGTYTVQAFFVGSSVAAELEVVDSTDKPARTTPKHRSPRRTARARRRSGR